MWRKIYIKNDFVSILFLINDSSRSFLSFHLRSSSNSCFNSSISLVFFIVCSVIFLAHKAAWFNPHKSKFF